MKHLKLVIARLAFILGASLLAGVVHAAEWRRAHPGNIVKIDMSHGGSGKQARAGGNDAKAREFVTRFINNVPVFGSGGGIPGPEVRSHINLFTVEQAFGG